MKKLRKLLRRWLGRPGTRRTLAGLTLATCFLATVTAQAGGHGGGELHINWWTWDQHAPPVGWFILDFLLFVWLIVHYTKKPIKAAFAQRHQQIKTAIEEAAKAHASASELYEEFQSKLADVEKEAASFAERGREDGATDRDRIIEAGNEYAERLRNDSKSVGDQEEAKAIFRLRRGAAAAVLDRTEQLLRDEISGSDRERLVEEAISDLEKSAPVASKVKKSRPAPGRPSVGGAP